jgi:2,4-dienoyl-CoA reductase-like NADH-dependent reductase (Old Yellow Enzyme family)
MSEQMASSDNVPNENFVRAYSQWAEGGWGAIITGQNLLFA